MPSADPAERKLISSIGAHVSWANTENRTDRTAPARKALDAKFLAEAGGDPTRAAHLRKAYYSRLALKSAHARRKAKQAREALDAIEQEVAEARAELDRRDGDI